MDLGNRILKARKAAKLTQSDLADMIDVSFQAVSSWERNEYAPDTENIIKLAKALGVSASYLIDEDSADIRYTCRDKIFSEDHMYTFVKSTASSKRMKSTLKALPFMKEAHDGQFRSSKDVAKVPYIYHPLLMACQAIALGIEDDDIIAAVLLHDVCEDCGVLPEELPVSRKVRETVELLTKAKGYNNDDYYKAISASRDAMLVKILDRCNNVSSMATAFSNKKMAKYVDETEKYIIPLMDKCKDSYPEFYNAMFLVKYQLLSVIETIKRTTS